MSIKKTVSPCWFIIETETVNGEPLVTWLLKQQVNYSSRERSWDSLYTSVMGHLGDLARSTGCNYSVLYWGLPEDAQSYIEHHSIEVN